MRKPQWWVNESACRNDLVDHCCATDEYESQLVSLGTFNNQIILVLNEEVVIILKIIFLSGKISSTF